MKMKTFARLSCLVAYIALACIPVDATPRSVNESNPVRKIYIAKAEPFENREPFISRWKRFNSYLKQELTRFGFIVVDEKAMPTPYSAVISERKLWWMAHRLTRQSSIMTLSLSCLPTKKYGALSSTFVADPEVWQMKRLLGKAPRR